MINHINAVHNSQKDHKCDSCGKAFSEAGSLKTHINGVHNGQKVHKCDSCGKAFSQAWILRGHINSVHNGIKDYKCDSCGKAFSQSGSLKNTLIQFIIDDLAFCVILKFAKDYNYFLSKMTYLQ